MHTPHDQPRPSIYYQYRVFDTWQPPTTNHTDATAPVVIAGAGPIGMVAALELARHGVRCVL